jgi:hypothetical protein
MIKPIPNVIFLYIIIYLCSCTGKNISGNYCKKHKTSLDCIEQSYKNLYKIKPFTIAFTDKKFNTVALEIITDSISYIYEFNPTETRLMDTLIKYNMPANGITTLIKSMQRISCTW